MLEVNPVVDRIGTGDAFAAGLIYGLLNFDDEKALNFANAACAIKHTILGDINYCSAEDIEEVMNGNSGGRIKR
ncbi:pfkB family carbohydrate kinase [compost metagenome]